MSRSTTPSVLTPEQRIQVLEHLETLSRSPAFMSSKRAVEFLRYVVEKAVADRQTDLRERTIGAELFGRPIAYDTANDAVVRVRASEVRRRLAEYYAGADSTGSVRITIPPGRYEPQFDFVTPKALIPEPPWQNTSAERTGPDLTVGPKAKSVWRQRFVKAILCACAAALLISVSWRLFSPIRKADRTGLTSIAVLPFENLSGDPGQEYFSAGLTDELIASIGQVSAVGVASRTSTALYRTRKVSIPQIGRELGVRAILEGTVQHSGTEVVITIRLIDAQQDRQLWSQTYTRALGDLLTVEDEISQRVAEEISVQTTSPEQRHLFHHERISEQAQDSYFHALDRIDASEPQEARTYLERAIAADPHYAQAHATLSLIYSWLGKDGSVPSPVAYRLAKQEAEAAQTNGDGLADTHVALAQSAADMDWDWSREDAELKRALQINPSSTTALWESALLLERIGKFQQSLSVMKQAMTLDPASSHVYTIAAATYYFARDYQAALHEIDLASQLPHAENAFAFRLGVIYTDKGMFPQAIEQFRLLGPQPYAVGHLGYAYAKAHQSQAALKALDQLLTLERSTGLGTYEEAVIYAALDRKAEALDALDRAYEKHDKGMEYLAIDPCLDSLRSDAHFKLLMKRMHLA